MAIFNTILVAYDGSSHSKKALEKAAEFMAEDPSVQTHVVSVTHPPHIDMYSLYGLSVSKEIMEEMEEASKEVMAEAKELLIKYKDTCHFVGLQGDAAQEILDYTDENKIDLILLGSRGLGTFKGMLLGSVSNRIVQQSDCHVLVMK